MHLVEPSIFKSKYIMQMKGFKDELKVTQFHLNTFIKTLSAYACFFPTNVDQFVMIYDSILKYEFKNILGVTWT